MDSQDTEINQLIKAGVGEAFKDFQTEFRAIIEAEIKREFKNAERLAKLLTEIEKRQNALLDGLEKLTISLQNLIDLIKQKGRICYAT